MDTDSSQGAIPSPQEEPNTQRNTLEGVNLDELANDPVALTQIQAHLQQNNLHLPVMTPDEAAMRIMREETPELYTAYIKAIESSVKASYIEQTYPYTEPAKTIKSGRTFGILAVICAFILCGYALYLDKTWFAGIIAGIDLVSLAAIFSNPTDKKRI